MRRIFIVGLMVHSLTGFTQTNIEKTIPAQQGQRLSMDFTWPELIRVQTWVRSEVLIKGVVNINNGENDDAFELEITNGPDAIRVRSFLKDPDNIPRHIVIKKGDREYFFRASDRNDPEVQKFLEENDGSYTYMSNGIIKDIRLEVFVPVNMETEITSKFGLVEVSNFQAPLTVSSKFGGVDAAVPAAAVGELSARTHFGEILSNLDIAFDSGKENGDPGDRWTVVSAKPGKGPRYSFESKFGKVYLRKPR